MSARLRAGDAVSTGIALLALTGLCSLVLAIAARPLATDDTWWHLAMGRLYATGDLWPRADPLLHTTVLRAPVPHEWLFQVLLHGLERSLGFTGLRVFHALALAGLLLGALAVFRRASRDLVAASLAGVTLLALAWFRLVQLRPELLSASFVVALHALWLAPRAGPDRARIAAGVALLVVFSNCHSLFALGPCLAIAALLGCALHALLRRACLPRDVAGDANGQRARRLALATAVGTLAAGLNPRGFAQHATFLTESSAGLIWKIRDDFLPWNPFSPPREAGPAFTPLAWATSDLLYALVLVVAGLRLLRLWRERRAADLETFDAVALGLALAAGAASLVSVRFHWLAFFPLLYLLRQWRCWQPSARGLRTALRGGLAAAAAALAIATPLAGHFRAYSSELSHEPEGYRADWLDDRYCGPAMRFLRDAGLEGRLYHPFNLGGFLGYWLAPRLTTFIDGRLDHVPAAVLDDYQAIRRASLTGPTPLLRERLARWGIDVFVADTFPPEWYPRRLSGTHLRRLSEWIPVHHARSCTVYLRRNPRNRANLERVVAYYAERGVPFRRDRGQDVSRVQAEAPDWAAQQRLRLPDQAALEALARGGSGASQELALETLAEHAWRIGDFRTQVSLHRRLLRLRGSDRRASLRLADAYLALGRPLAATRALEPVLRESPDDPEGRFLAALAERTSAAVGSAPAEASE